MRVFNTMILRLLLAAPVFVRAAEPDDPALPGSVRRDPVFTRIDAAFRARFPDATVQKVERKEKERREGDIFVFSWGFSGEKNEVFYTLTLSDALNKKYDVVFNSHAELVATEKYKTTFDALPTVVQAAIELKAPNSSGSTDVLEARLEHGVYKVSGRINGKKANVELELGSIKPPKSAMVLTPEEELRKSLPLEPKPTEIAPPIALSGKPEIAAGVDGPFRAMFPDATVLHVDHKDSPNVTIHVFSIGGGDSKYELTLSDPLNKKFKAVFTDTGHLYSTSTFFAPFERLPREVQTAIEQLTAVTDRSVVLEVRVDRKTLTQTEHEEYKVTGKINGVKISVEVPIFGTR